MYFFTASCFPHLHFQLLASQVIAVFSLVCILLEISYTYMYVCINTHTHTYMCAKLLQSCLILCDPMDCSPPGFLSMGFSKQEYWSGLPFPTAGDLSYPGLKRCPFCILGWHMDSLPLSVIWKALCVCVCVCVPCHHIYILYN